VKQIVHTLLTLLHFIDSSLQLCKVPQKKLKTDTNQDSSRKQSFCDKQLYKNQSSCEKVSQIAAEKSFSTSNHSLCNKSQTWIINPLQASNIVDFDESVALESEIKVQSKSLKCSFFFCVNNVIFNKLIHKTKCLQWIR
jgi:hypothetical protein